MGEFLNLTDAFYEGVGEYGVPELARVESVDIKKWKTFNYAMNTKLPPKTGITFFCVPADARLYGQRKSLISGSTGW